jgi:phosphoribosylformylglycinamidine synthase
MTTFTAELVIEGKANVADPEGEVIERDLIQKGGYSTITNLRTGKYIRLSVEANNTQEAHDLLVQMCNELRIYNPVAHSLTVRVQESPP